MCCSARSAHGIERSACGVRPARPRRALSHAERLLVGAERARRSRGTPEQGMRPCAAHSAARRFARQFSECSLQRLVAARGSRLKHTCKMLLRRARRACLARSGSTGRGVDGGLASGGRAQRPPVDSVVQERTEKIQAWLKRFDVVIIGPGLGRDDQMTTKTVINVRRPRRRKHSAARMAAGLVSRGAFSCKEKRATASLWLNALVCACQDITMQCGHAPKVAWATCLSRSLCMSASTSGICCKPSLPAPSTQHPAPLTPTLLPSRGRRCR